MIFVTGFPGFLGSAMVERLLARTGAETSVTCLVQPQMLAVAQQRAQRIEGRDPLYQDRLHLVTGDLTEPDLGLGDAGATLAERVTAIYHFAAVYDLGVTRELGMRVNVIGTRHLLAFARACADLRRLHYVSTCYVSGRYNGTFRETDLDVGQRFNNFYEETKFIAEVDVQAAAREGLPVTVYRPSIVVGDSRTGATPKFDGPYYLIQWMLRAPRLAPVPVVGDPSQVRVNLVPIDFVIDAMTALSGRAPGNTPEPGVLVYQLCDPNAATVDDLLRLFADAADRRLLRIKVPEGMLKGALRRTPALRSWAGIPPAVLDYFTHPTRYTAVHTLRDLQGTGIAPPRIASYADRLVGYMRRTMSEG